MQAHHTSPSAPYAYATPAQEKAIFEHGAATSWNVSGGAATFAPNFAVEISPIENWLESWALTPSTKA